MNIIQFIFFLLLINFNLYCQNQEFNHDKFDNSAYFNLNEIKKFEILTLKFLQDLIEKYPLICIEFIQTINVNESKRIAKKRMKTFKKTLKKAGLGIKNFRFNDEILVVKEIDFEQRSRIQGVVYSINQNCK